MISERQAEQLTLGARLFLLEGLTLQQFEVRGVMFNSNGVVQIKTTSRTIVVTEAVRENLFFEDADGYKAQFIAIKAQVGALSSYLKTLYPAWYKNNTMRIQEVEPFTGRESSQPDPDSPVNM